jgi:hypothetical protein
MGKGSVVPPSGRATVIKMNSRSKGMEKSASRQGSWMEGVTEDAGFESSDVVGLGSEGVVTMVDICDKKIAVVT